jgi:hypothetical protein
VSKYLLSCEHLPSWNYRRVIKLGTSMAAPEMCVVIMSVTYAWAVMSRTWTDERNFLLDEWTQRRSTGTPSKCRRTGKVTRSDLLGVGKRDECIVSLVMEKRSRTVSVFCHSWCSASVTRSRSDNLAGCTSVLAQLGVQRTSFTPMKFRHRFENMQSSKLV